MTLLRQTTSANVAEIKQAQATLQEAEKQPGFCIRLLQMLGKLVSQQAQQSPSQMQQVVLENPVLLAGGIFFKNYIKKFYGVEESNVKEDERNLIKENLVELMMRAPSKLQAQLSAALEEIASLDFPDHWQGLLPQLKESLEKHPQHRPVILESMDTIFRVSFVDQIRSNELMRSVKYVVDNFAKEHLAVTKLVAGTAEGSGTSKLQRSLLVEKHDGGRPFFPRRSAVVHF